MPTDHDQPTRRDIVKRALYVPPAILTLKATPAFAKAGSEKPVKRPPVRPKQPSDEQDEGLYKQPK